MAKASAGILMFRRRDGRLEVLLVHPGGPFWRKRDAGAWFIPRGEIEPGEDTLAAARREFSEETGWAAGEKLIALGQITQSSGKTVTAFAFQGDFDPASLRSNQFEMEWPLRSGQRQSFPEVDRAAWFTLERAATQMHASERPLLQRLAEAVG